MLPQYEIILTANINTRASINNLREKIIYKHFQHLSPDMTLANLGLAQQKWDRHQILFWLFSSRSIRDRLQSKIINVAANHSRQTSKFDPQIYIS